MDIIVLFLARMVPHDVVFDRGDRLVDRVAVTVPRLQDGEDDRVRTSPEQVGCDRHAPTSFPLYSITRYLACQGISEKYQKKESEGAVL